MRNSTRARRSDKGPLRRERKCSSVSAQEQWDVPGVALGLVQDGRIVFTTVVESVGMALYDFCAARVLLAEAQRLAHGSSLDA